MDGLARFSGDPLRRQGLFATDDVERIPLHPQPAQGALARSLVEAVKHYVLFLPYPMMLGVPESPIDPLAESRRIVGVPSDIRYWDLPYELVELGEHGRQLGLEGRVVFGVPRPEWPQIANFLSSCLLADPRLHDGWQLRLQPVTFADPFLVGRLRVNSEHWKVAAVALAVESKVRSVFLRPTQVVAGTPVIFRVRVANSISDPRIGAFCAAFFDGQERPHQTAEESHGQFEFGPQGEVDEPLGGGNCDGGTTGR